MENLNDIITKLKDDINNTSMYYNFEVFEVDNIISWNKVNYEFIEIKKKKYYKFNGDEQLYPYSSTYTEMKHEILLYYKQILKIAGNLFDNDLIQYINQKFINKLNKGDYYNFLRFTMYMWYYYMRHLNDNRIIYDKITYKQFRKWCLNNKLYSGGDLTINQGIINLLLVYEQIKNNTENINDIQIFINKVVKNINFLWCLSQS